MNNQTKNLIKSYILDYLKLQVKDFKIINKKNNIMFTCPLCHEHSNNTETANIFPLNSNNVYCFDPAHGKLGNIFDMVKIFEPDMVDLSEDDIGEYLSDLLNIKTETKINKLLATYQSLGWSLVPVAKNDKKANIEKEWQKKEHRSASEWKDWLEAGLNVGVNCGLSNVTILDIDAMPADLKKKWYKNELKEDEKKEAIKIRDENIKKVLKGLGNPKTLMQTSLGGIHLFFEHVKELQKTYVEINGVHVDIETNEGQVLIEPSIVFGESRIFNDTSIIKMPTDIKDLLIGKMNTIHTPIKVEKNNDKIKGLDGICNQTFVKILGKFRKFMNVKQVEQAGYIVNDEMLDDPMQHKDLRRMIREIEKYHEIDMDDLSDKIVERLEKIEEATIRDLTYSLRYEQKDIEDCLRYLVDQDKVYKKGTKYKLFAKANWQENFVESSKLLEYKVPYFEKHAVCRRGDMLIIGARTGRGKTHIALNILKQLVNQKIKPNYISSEPGNRFSKIAMTLALKEGEFKWCNHYRPEQVELEDETVTIIDWLLPENYAEVDKLYSRFAQQLDKHGGLLFIFTQLKKDGSFFAPNMVDFFASIACTYNHESYSDKSGKKVYDNENTYFLTNKIRESRTGRQIIKIPTKYNKDTKLLELRDE